MSIPLAANLNTLFTPDVSWAERCARAAAAGFRFAEILTPYDAPAPHYRQWLDAAGLQTVLINTPMDGRFGLAAVEGAQQDFRHAFDQALDTAQTLGAHLIHVLAGRTDDDTCVSLAALLGNLEYAIGRVECTDMIITLEALNRHDVPGYFYHHPVGVAQVLAALPSPHLRQQFDVYHTQCEGLDVVGQLRACLPGVAHVQIAQAPARGEPGADNAELWQALRVLRDSGYAGWVGCEYRPARGFEAGLGWMAQAAALLSLADGHA